MNSGIIDIGAVVRTVIREEVSRWKRSDRLHTAKEVSRILKISIEHVYKLADAGELRKTLIGISPSSKRDFRISSSAIREFIRRRQESE